MGGINNRLWRMKAVLRPFGPSLTPAGETSSSPRAGWSVRLHLSQDEIHPPDCWLRFQPPRPSRPAYQPLEADPAPRIRERRGWTDPAP